MSHSSLDGSTVEEIAAFLRDEHHDVFLDRHPTDGILGGEAWEKVLYDRLHAADAVVAVVTDNHIASMWCFAEVALAKSLGCQLLPVRTQPGASHPLLRANQTIDYVADPERARRSLGQRLSAIDAGGGVAWDRSRPLFPGLVAFDTSDSPVFFGRKQEIRDLAALVRSLVAQRLPQAVMVVGASGSGKSSLVRAGLVPELSNDGWWTLPPVLPGPDPLKALAFSFGQAWKVVTPRTPIDLPTLTERVESDLDGLAAELLMAAPGRRERLLVIVDQFEEVFTRAFDNQSEVFLEVLRRAAEQGRSTSIVATMRSEFQSDLLACEPAGSLRSNQFTLPPLGHSQLGTIITGPARKGRLTFDTDLVQRLVDDTGSGDALPLLAYVLRKLTDRAEPGDRIELADYELIGGVHGALRTQADSALEAATEATGEGEATILRTLIELVSMDAEGRPARRRIPRADLDPVSLTMIDEFVADRLINTDDVSGEPTLAVSHEALFTAWPKLQSAIRDRNDELQLRRRLEQAADDWVDADRDQSMLWHGDQLRRARGAIAEGTGWHDREREFVNVATAIDVEARRRDADILADRIRAAGLADRDSELALLLLLEAADKAAVTDDVIGGLRHALSKHSLVNRFESPDAPVTAMAVADGADLVAVADRGSNPIIRPSTRPTPPPPAAQCRVSVWRGTPATLVDTAWIDGRDVTAIAVAEGPNGWRVVAAIDDRLAVIESTSAALPIGQFPLKEAPASISLSAGGARATLRSATGETTEFDIASSSFRAVADGGPGSTDAVPFDRRSIGADEHGITLSQVDVVDAPTLVAEVDGEVAMIRWRELTRLAVTSDGRLVNLSTGESRTMPGPVHAMSADGDWLLVGKPARLHHVSTDRESPLDIGAVRAASFSDDGRRLAIAEWGALTVVDIEAGTRIARLGEHDDEEGDLYTGVAFAGGGTRLVSSSLGGSRAHVWDIATGRALSPMPDGMVDLSPDGAVVVTHEFRTIAADLARGIELRLAMDSNGSCLIVAPDGRSMVILKPYDQTGGFWPEEYNVPEGHRLFDGPEPCVAATFTADSRHLIVARVDGTVHMTPSRHPDDVLARARRHVFRRITAKEKASFDLAF